MKHNINLLFLVAFLLIVSATKADQLTITFTNPVPTAPVNCGDTWSEQGVNMEFENSIDYCGFNYGNGSINFEAGVFYVDLSELGRINTIAVSYIYKCCTDINFCYNDNLIVSETIPHTYPNTFINYQFTNNDNNSINMMKIINHEVGGTILDITIDYEPICESEPISNLRNGDVYLNDACYGVIMTSPSGNCFRARVADNGMLFTEPVECP